MHDGDDIRVLIVEDDPLMALDLMALLDCAGFEVLGVAESGEQAVVLAKARPVDVILMDVDLSHGGGRLDGLETAAIILGQSAAAVVFVTGEAPDEVDRRCRALGGAQVVAKPFDDRKLLDAVRHAA